MRGHLQERGEGSWRIKAYLGRDAEGRKRYTQRTITGMRRDAERELSRLLVEVDEGRHAAAAPLSFGELLDRWLDVKRLAVEPTTMSSYEWVAKRYLRPALGERKVAALRPIELDALYAELQMCDDWIVLGASRVRRSRTCDVDPATGGSSGGRGCCAGARGRSSRARVAGTLAGWQIRSNPTRSGLCRRGNGRGCGRGPPDPRHRASTLVESGGSTGRPRASSQ